MSEFHHIDILCPKCNQKMEWLAVIEETPHVVEYKCDNCAWQGDFNHFTNEYDELTPDQYVEVQNTNMDELIAKAIELGCEITKSDNES